jgi:hypothetical protein
MIVLTLLACNAIIEFPPPFADSAWDTGTRETTETTETPAPPTGTDHDIVELSGKCTTAGWRWRVKALGWVTGATVDVFDEGLAVREHHALAFEDTDPDGAWDQLGVGPLPIVAADKQGPGSSQFSCTDPVSAVVRIQIDGAIVACGTWGANPSGALAAMRTVDPTINDLGGCAAFGP